ncbi:phage terminase small subunit P27 family [Micrococcus luteus]|uniref:phage terminase small subunit P27 family n=1 Tax=Micrococcus luteus TaxID=1270 RepID=UPI003444E3D3
MGQRGPQAAPARLKLLKGRGEGKDSGGRKVNEEPKFEREAPEPPEWLSDLAREQWALCAPALDDLDLLKPEDQAVFTAFCEAWATYVLAIREVRAGSLTLVTDKGYEYKNPALSIAESASKDLLRFAREFGLTPASEQNLGKPMGDEGDGGQDPYAGTGEAETSTA